MVAVAYKYTEIEEVKEAVKDPLFLPLPLKYGGISIKQISDNGYRLDASTYNMEAIAALHRVMHNKHGHIMLLSPDGLIQKASYPGRYKRVYSNKSKGVPFYLPSQLNEVYLKPSKYISSRLAKTLDNDKITANLLLLSRSGTIGNCTISSKTTIGKIFSDDVIRISFKGEYDLGYTYAFLNTEIGLTILQSNNYGAVIDHIEPEHLSKVPIPNAPESEKKIIHDLIVESFNLRDQSNDLIDEAQAMLYKELGLTAKKDEIKPTYYSGRTKIRAFTIKASQLNTRFDASYHLPEISETISLISRNADEVIALGDSRITSDIILPGRFKRIYVDKEKGIPFLGGKQIGQLNANGLKYLSRSFVTTKFCYSYMISENDIILPARGSIGKCQLVPKHWSGFFISDNIIKIIHNDKSLIGYVYLFLQTHYGETLIKKEISGAVVDVVEPINLLKIPIPLLKNKNKQKKINDLVLKANNLRYQAYIKEQDAIKKMNKILDM